MAILFVLLLTIFCSFINCKVYERCELARELKHVHKFPKDQIATWVCIAKHESTFNTSAVNKGSGDHGLFQISDLFWCSPPGNGLACNARCSDFEDDDISDDVVCIKRIFKEHQYLSGNGFNAWAVYPLYCKHDVSKYIERCFDNEIDNHEITTSVPEPQDEDDVYEFPPLPKPPKIIKFRDDGYEFPPLPTLSTQKPKLQTTHRKIFSTTSLKPFKNTKFSRNYKQIKPFSNYKQEFPTKMYTFPTLQPTSNSSSFTSSVNYFSSRSDIHQKSTTLKPLSFVYENIHSDHKREQKLYGSDLSEYSFLWTANGFRLVRN